MRSCGTCEFKGLYMRPDGEMGATICRRHPPVVTVVLTPTQNGPQLVSPTSWPEINDRQWCGEYKPALAIAAS